jgi:hypothetical protein
VTPQERSARIEAAARVMCDYMEGVVEEDDDTESVTIIAAGIKARGIALRAALAVVAKEGSTLAERIAAPGFKDEVEKARALLDARDAGWNEGVEACIKKIETYSGPVMAWRALFHDLIIVAPPAEGTMIPPGGSALIDGVRFTNDGDGRVYVAPPAEPRCQHLDTTEVQRRDGSATVCNDCGERRPHFGVFLAAPPAEQGCPYCKWKGDTHDPKQDCPYDGSVEP